MCNDRARPLIHSVNVVIMALDIVALFIELFYRLLSISILLKPSILVIVLIAKKHSAGASLTETVFPTKKISPCVI